jgi:hypothetical protein
MGDSLTKSGNTKGGSITVLLTSFGIGCMITDNFCFYLQNGLIRTSQTGGQRYSDTSPFSILWIKLSKIFLSNNDLGYLLLQDIPYTNQASLL